MNKPLRKLPPHLWVALSNWLSRAGSVGAQLLCVPLLSTLLSPAEFAAYAITVSLMNWYQLIDFGMGNSAQNHVAEARARGVAEGHFVAAAALVGGLVLCAAAVLIWPLSGLLASALLGKLALPPQADARLVLALSGLLFVGAALGTVATKLLYALGRGVYANLIALLNSLGFLLLLWGLARQAAPEHRLLASVLAYTLPMGISGLLTLTWLAVRRGAWNLSGVREALRQLGGRSWRFWLFALLAAATLNVDYLIMSRTLPAEQIAAYNVLFRIYWAGMALYSGLLSATWPVFSAMNVRGDHAGIHRHIRLYLGAGLGVLALGSLAAAPLLPWILSWLAPGLHVSVTAPTLLLFSAYIGLRLWTDTYAVALQALSEVGIFLKVVPLQALLSVGLQWTLAQRFGLNGILLGLILSFVLTVVWILPMTLRRRTRPSTAPHLPPAQAQTA